MFLVTLVTGVAEITHGIMKTLERNHNDHSRCPHCPPLRRYRRPADFRRGIRQEEAVELISIISSAKDPAMGSRLFFFFASITLCILKTLL
nr:MAG TPA: hypothetical protein [Caudoviricetes sp.]